MCTGDLTYLDSGLVSLQLADVEVLNEVCRSSAISFRRLKSERGGVPFLETAETVNDLEKVGAATRRAWFVSFSLYLR